LAISEQPHKNTSIESCCYLGSKHILRWQLLSGAILNVARAALYRVGCGQSGIVLDGSKVQRSLV
jgi:hypothetical protein